MTTKPKTPARWTSGFCATGNPPDSHRRCDDHPREDGTPCMCDDAVHTISPNHPNRPTEDLPTDRQSDGYGSVLRAEPTGGRVVYDMPEQEYHTDPTSLSQSGAKTLLKSPAKYQWEREHPVFKDVFDFGSAAHALVLGAGPKIHEVKADAWRSNAAKDEREAARKRGEIPLLTHELRKVEDMAEALTHHNLASQLLAKGGTPEVSLFCPDEETGVLRRGRLDFHNAVEDLLVDYKTSQSSDPAEFQRSSVAQFGYHIQHAWYVDLARDLGFPIRSMLFIVQEKEPPYLVTVVELTPDAVDAGRARARKALQMYRDCTEAGVWPGYTPDTQITPIDIPEWAYRESREA